MVGGPFLRNLPIQNQAAVKNCIIFLPLGSFVEKYQIDKKKEAR